jgi:hypothetical protein
LEYNSDGKLSKTVESGMTNYTTTYTYLGITINVIGDISQTEIKDIGIYSLNSQGYVSNITGTNGNSNYVIIYEYDKSGYCTKETYSSDNIIEITTYTYANGNMTSTTLMSGTMSNTTTYEYYTDKDNTLDYAHRGIIFMGKSNKNLIKKATIGNSIITYTYDYDQDNYVTKQTRTASDGSIQWESYTYK